MATSRKNKTRKQNLDIYKTKQKTMNANKQLSNAMPPVRNVPTWAQDAQIVVSGYEWETIQNGLAQIQLAQQAVQAVMSRNILNGTIQMDFLKLNPATLEYEEMPADEKAKHKAEYQKMIEDFKKSLETPAPIAQPDPAGTTKLVDVTGAEISSDAIANEALTTVAEESKPEAKVVKMERR